MERAKLDNKGRLTIPDKYREKYVDKRGLKVKWKNELKPYPDREQEQTLRYGSIELCETIKKGILFLYAQMGK